MVSAAFKYVPQTAATTFSFYSVCFFFYAVISLGGRCSGSGSSTCLLGWTSRTSSPSGMWRAMTATVIVRPSQVHHMSVIVLLAFQANHLNVIV